MDLPTNLQHMVQPRNATSTSCHNIAQCALQERHPSHVSLLFRPRRPWLWLGLAASDSLCGVSTTLIQASRFSGSRSQREVATASDYNFSFNVIVALTFIQHSTARMHPTEIRSSGLTKQDMLPHDFSSPWVPFKL